LLASAHEFPLDNLQEMEGKISKSLEKNLTDAIWSSQMGLYCRSCISPFPLSSLTEEFEAGKETVAVTLESILSAHHGEI